MFNTFGSDGVKLTVGNQIKMYHRQKNFEMNNLSTIQLNPWNDQSPKSPNNFFQGDNFPLFARLPSKPFSTLSKYLVPKQDRRKSPSQNYIYQKKNWYENDLKKKEYYLSKRKTLKSSEKSHIKEMNKTISVHNIQGDMLFGPIKVKQRRQNTLQQQQKRHRTTINNPMYGKFCNRFNFQKLQIINTKALLRQQIENKRIENLSQDKILDLRRKISTFSMARADPESAKSIHEVRKRLKSTSEVMRKNQESKLQRENKQVQKGQIYLELKMNTTEDLHMLKRQNRAIKRVIDEFQCRSDNILPLNDQLMPSSDQTLPLQQSDRQVNYKISKKKNLYIGCRKFFNPSTSSNHRQRQHSIKKDIDRKQFLDLKDITQLVLLKVNQTPEQRSALQANLQKMS